MAGNFYVRPLSTPLLSKENLRVFKIEGFNYLKMLVQKYRKKRLTLETALYVQMTASLVSKSLSWLQHDLSFLSSPTKYSYFQSDMQLFYKLWPTGWLELDVFIRPGWPVRKFPRRISWPSYPYSSNTVS